MHHLGNFQNGLIRDSETLGQCFKSAVVAVVGKFHLKHIIGNSVAMIRWISVENKLGFRVNECANEPCRTHTVNFRTRPSEPSLAHEFLRGQRRRVFGFAAAQISSAFQKHLGVLRSRAVKEINLTNFLELACQFFQVCRELFVRTPSIPRHQLGKRRKQPRVIRRPRFVELANDVFTVKPLNLSDVNNRRFATAIADLLCQPLQALVVLWLVGKQIGRRFQRKRSTLFQLPPEVDSRSAFLCGQSVKQKNPFVRGNHGGEAMKCNRYFNLKHLDKILISHLMKSLFGFLGLFSLLTTLAQAETLDTSKIEQIIGLKGALNTNEGVFKVTSPRNDVKISVDDWTMPP